MDKPTQDLFILITEAIHKFKAIYPEFNNSEIAFNSIAMFSSTLINIVAKGKTLKIKFKILEDLIRKEKEWIRYDHERKN